MVIKVSDELIYQSIKSNKYLSVENIWRDRCILKSFSMWNCPKSIVKYHKFVKMYV